VVFSVRLCLSPPFSSIACSEIFRPGGGQTSTTGWWRLDPGIRRQQRDADCEGVDEILNRPMSAKRCAASYTVKLEQKEPIMSKAHDAKKTEKKVATRTPKEKKEAKKLKKDASKRQ